MADFTADFEAGTNGNSITTAGGEASTTAWTRIFGTYSYDNTHAAHGSLAAKCPTSGDYGLLWDATYSSEHYGRLYLYATAIPSAPTQIVRFGESGCTIAVGTSGGNDGKIVSITNSGSVAGSVEIALNQWVRIEYHFITSATVGNLEVKLFNSAESTSPTETISPTADRNTGASVPAYIGFGHAGGGWGTNFWIDDVIANATSYPGPAALVSPTQTFKRFYGPAQLTDSAADLYTVPASTVARVMGIHASNPSGSPVDLTLSIGADGAATRVYDGYSLAADGVLDDHSPYELAAGEKIQGFASSAATVNLTITGWEKPA